MILISNLASLATTPDTVTVAGYYAPGDGGGGDFTYDSASTLTPDGGIVFASSSGGNWVRIFSGPINVQWFGAIMSSASGLTDVTAEVHAARDSFFTQNGGTLYFPKGSYVGAFEISYIHGEVNIVGDGEGTILKSNGSNPVLRLGYHQVYHWRFSKISSLTIDGDSQSSDGVLYDDTANSPTSGRWNFENVTFRDCDKAVHKPKGNIGNRYTNCSFIDNNFGYYAKDSASPIMHAGCEIFSGGRFENNTIAAICVIEGDTLDYGQLIIDGASIEGNPGFGIFLKFSQVSSIRMTVNPVELRNIWMENNATAASITIDGTNYAPYDFYLEQVRSAIITGSVLRKFSSKASSITLNNCRTDYSTVVIDSDSYVIAEGIRFAAGTPSEDIIVNSISYDGVPDYTGWLHIPTSVWGPLRSVEQTANDNIMISQHYDNSNPFYTFGDPFTSGPSVNTNSVDAGVLRNNCASLSSSSTGIMVADLGNYFDLSDTSKKYYIWSIHAYLCSGTATGWIGSAATDPGYGFKIGQVIMKPKQWVCSYGIKLLNGFNSPPPAIYLNMQLDPNSTVFLADYQVLKFDSLQEAQSFLNSRSFAQGDSLCSQ